MGRAGAGVVTYARGFLCFVNYLLPLVLAQTKNLRDDSIGSRSPAHLRELFFLLFAKVFDKRT